MTERVFGDAAAFLVTCASAGGVLLSFALVVVVPVVAWCLVRALHRAIERVEDPRWRAPLGAIAATVPGMSFAVGAVALLVHIARSGCLSLDVGRTVFAILAVLLVTLYARACARAVGRAKEATLLVHASLVAPDRLRTAASAVGIQARLLPSGDRLVVLAGLVHPIVIVSSGALARLSDDELTAALHHELAHHRRGDQALMAAIAFCGDFSPLPVSPLVATYRRARELAADHEACRYSQCEELAAAILHLAARSRLPSTSAVCALNDGHGTTERLHALLNDAASASTDASALSRLAIVGSIAVAILIGFIPAAVALLVPPCTAVMSMS